MSIFFRKFLVIICGTLLLSGCATMRHPVPLDLVDKAQVSDMPEIRVIMGGRNTALQKNLILSSKQEDPKDFPVGPDGIKVYPVLAVSGGSANGAYGAGLLKGWSKEGSRPVFKIVTGVSIGAIIAPFAFLGKEYDDVLEKGFTTISTKDIASIKMPLTILFGNSLAGNAPLVKTVNNLIDEDILEKIAARHRKGCRLFIGTSDLDAERLVVWDMGAIACRGDLEFFRKVLLASVAMPTVFPPSIFHVIADGKEYDELHADGATLTQVFTTYELIAGMQDTATHLGVDTSNVKGKLYIIRNGYMSPTYKKIKNNLPSLAERAFDMVTDSEGAGDAYRIYVFAEHTNSDYNLAFIPPDFKQDNKEMFDPKDMKRLFDRGYQDAVGGYKWHKAPPGVEGSSDQSLECISKCRTDKKGLNIPPRLNSYHFLFSFSYNGSIIYTMRWLRLRALILLSILWFAFLVSSNAGAENINNPIVLKTRMGKASWYYGFLITHNKFFRNGHYAAMWGVPIGTKVRVTDLDNGKSIIVTINDRGPNKRLVAKGRIIDLAAKAFYDLNGNFKPSTIRVKLEILRQY